MFPPFRIVTFRKKNFATVSKHRMQRWLCYLDTNGYGGNAELKKMIEKDERYTLDHFEFAVPETFCSHATDQEIIDRESRRKETLHSREELNRN